MYIIAIIYPTIDMLLPIPHNALYYMAHIMRYVILQILPLTEPDVVRTTGEKEGEGEGEGEKEREREREKETLVGKQVKIPNN